MKKSLKLIFLQIWRLKLGLEKKAILHRTSKFNLRTYLEGKNKIGAYTDISNSYLGLGTYIGSNTYLVNSKIGRYCSIGSDIKVIFGNHPTKTFISTHPCFFSTNQQAGFTFADKNYYKEIDYLSSGNKSNLIEVGNDVWIGSNVLIQSGVKIGDGSIIGTGSLIRKDIEPYSINVGSPSRIIGYRFDFETIKYLKQNPFWEKDFEWLSKNFKNLHDIEKYKLIDKI